MRDNIVQGYVQQTVSVEPYFKGSIMRWLSLNYDVDYVLSRLMIGGDNQ